MQATFTPLSTAKVISLIFGGLVLFSVIAWIWRPAAGPKDKVTLVWVSDNNPARSAQIEAFNQEQPGLNLVLDYGNSGLQKILLQSATGIGPDVFDFENEDIETLVGAGILDNVTAAADKMGFSAKKDMWPTAYHTVTLDGQQYGYPCNTGANILFYNKNVFDYFGVPYPEGILTWDQFVEMARRVNSATNPQPDKRSIFAVSGFTWRNFFESMHGEFFTEDGRLEIANSVELHRAFAMHKEFLFTDQIMPSSVQTKAMSSQGGWGGQRGMNQFASGRFAMLVSGHWSLIALSQAYQQSLADLQSRGLKVEDIPNPLDRPLRMGAVLIPKFADRAPCYRLQARVAGINMKSPRREQALVFLQYLAGPTYARLLNGAADWLPSNPKYAMLGVEPGPDDLDRMGLQRATIEAVSYGYTLRVSPFLLKGDVYRVLGSQADRMESNASLSVDTLIKSADAELKTLIRRNLERSPDLKKLYIERFGEEAFQQL